MVRKASEAVPEGNDPVPQKEELASGQSTLADIYRVCVERFDRMVWTAVPIDETRSSTRFLVR